ncbi:2,3-diaminopropionate biosynthesis protein SbnA [Streptomyces tendae]|uniref:2,3-diaminopropionate biosynthesis protein SbnA n=1 Tax=Streptomyces tendae TaxID=1932 RepID=UPI0037239C75
MAGTGAALTRARKYSKLLYRDSSEVASEHHFLSLPGLIDGVDVWLKLEGVNLAGSIKLKAAKRMVENAERSGQLRPGGRIVESSSGSLGVALSMIAAARNYAFTCVVDPNFSDTSLAAVRAFGAQILQVRRADANGGYLQARLALVRQCLERDPELVWLNQYSNQANPAAHEEGTAKSILQHFPQLDYLFVGVGTAGTLMGCAARFRDQSPGTRIVAVDAVGSVTFGGPARPRHIPGLGASTPPPLFAHDHAHRHLRIREIDAIRCCRMLARRYGYLAGGSTGSIVAGVRSLRAEFEPGSVLVALSPDTGDRYYNTVYDDDWVLSHYGAEALSSIYRDGELESITQ